MTRRRDVPEDFPRQSTPGAVAGTQPKLLVRRVEGRYKTALTDEQLRTRYEACEDLARQLFEYASRKLGIFGWSSDEALNKIEESVARRVSAGDWDLSPDEIGWVVKRTQQLLSTRVSER